MDASTRAAIAVDYEHSLPQIEQLARRFFIRFRVSVDELMADANLIFMQMYGDHRFGDSTKWETRVHQWMWMTWLDIHRPNFTRNGKHEYAELTSLPTGARPVDEDPIGELLALLSEDAAVVVDLTLCPPKELFDAAEKRGGEPRNYRACLRQYLKDLGWAAGRIRDAFDEIRTA